MIETLRSFVVLTIGQPLDTAGVSHRRPFQLRSKPLLDAWAGDRHPVAKQYLNPEEFHDAPVRELRALGLAAPLDIAPRLMLLRPLVPSLGPIVVYECLEGDACGIVLGSETK